MIPNGTTFLSFLDTQVPEDLEARTQPLLPSRPGPSATQDAPERAFFAAPHTDSRFIAWRVPVSVHDYELTRAQPAGVRFWQQEVSLHFLHTDSIHSLRVTGLMFKVILWLTAGNVHPA